ncbi:TPT1 [Branchiostoma lanceolatum]|uniref:TPT1 protein n=1 Tax=Branchiostoma lanceolatum TaxID=7740 RepID=A0A8J9ZSE3_BRALA|nr:TPT1 [Branchiostoma lanceolatum]
MELRATLLALFLCGITTHFSTGLTIYRDVISGDEMFSDTFKIRLRDDGIFYEVEGRLVTRRKSTFDDHLIMEGADPVDIPDIDSVTSGVDIVLNHNLQETSFTKEQYKEYMNGYFKRIKEHLEKKNPGRVKVLMKDVQSVYEEILAHLKEWQFFRGESNNEEGMVALLNFDRDDDTPYMLFFKDGLEEEKG